MLNAEMKQGVQGLLSQAELVRFRVGLAAVEESLAASIDLGEGTPEELGQLSDALAVVTDELWPKVRDAIDRIRAKIAAKLKPDA